MKKRIFSRVLALFMALSMLTTTVFAASFDDLQNAINGTGGQEFTRDDQNYLGYGDSLSNEQESPKYEIETSKGENNSLDVTLNTDVKYDSTTDKNSTITIGEGKDVNLELNNNNITGTAGSDVIDVKGDLTITGGDEEGKNTISGGATGIDVEQGGKLALDSVTVTNNEIGVSFFDNLSVTFIGDQNVVSGNSSKQISGDGKVNFELGEKTYKVDAKTAETLLANKDSVAANGDNWILAKNGENTYTVIYTAGAKWYISQNDVQNAINNATEAAGCDISEITEFVVPNEVTTADTMAFKDCSNLKKVTMRGVTTIGWQAFSGCTELETVELSPNGATKISQHAFENCTALKTVNLSADIEKLENYVFMGCSSFNVDLSQFAKLQTIGTMAFQNSGMSGNLVFPASLTSIGNNAFEGCKNLTGVDLSKSNMTILDQMSFLNCTGLTAVELPDSLTQIGQYVFQGCSSLTEIEIPANVEKIGDAAFRKCGKITDVKFANGSKLKTIGFNAFYECADLKSMTLPEGLTSIGSGALFELTTVIFPATLTNVAAGAFYPGNTKCAILNYTEGMTAENISTAVEAVKAGSTRVDKNLATNIYVVNGDESVGFYRENITADFVHASVDAKISEIDGSVNLTSVSGTITTDRETFTLPNIAGIEASIDTNGNITIEVPEGWEEYPYGATVTVNPDGSIDIEAHDAPPVELPDFTFDADTAGADAGTTIDDGAIPLAGLISRAQLVSYLYVHEGRPDGEDAEGEYTLAWAWAVENEIEDEKNDPEEIVTGAILREVMTNYAKFLGTTFDVKIDVEDDVPVMNCDAILAEFYASLEAKAA